jgi:hypothetical protein
MKAVAIPYIIALILGIVVVGVIGYWLFVVGGTGPGQASVTQCNAKKTTWCADWAREGFRDEDFDGFRDKPPAPEWDSFARGCTALGVEEPEELECRSITGIFQ